MSLAAFSTLLRLMPRHRHLAEAKFDHASVGFPLAGDMRFPLASAPIVTSTTITTYEHSVCKLPLKDYQGATNPNHVSAKFSQSCEQCHNTTSWSNASFNHNATAFPLTGMHTVPPRQCTDCHVNNNYNLTVTTCVSCHLKDFQGTTNPNHVTSNFPQTCEQCHNTTSWLNATFNHSSTGFALTGSHAAPPRLCSDCHVNNNYNLTNTACVSCHQNGLQQRGHPRKSHRSWFPNTCETCHDTILWTDAIFNHTTTGFQLPDAYCTSPPVRGLSCQQ